MQQSRSLKLRISTAGVIHRPSVARFDTSITLMVRTVGRVGRGVGASARMHCPRTDCGPLTLDA